MKKTIIVFSFVALLILLTSGCSSYSQILLEPQVRLGIKTIGLLNFENPKNYNFYYVDPYMPPGGLSGGVVHIVHCEGIAKKFTKELKSQGFDYATEMKVLLMDNLTENGYEVRLIDVERKNVHEPVKNYKKIKPDVPVDVYMDFCGIWVGFSDYCKGKSKILKFAPRLSVLVRLIDPVSSEILYQEIYCYGGCFKDDEDCIRFHPSEKYIYEGIDPSSQDPQLLAEGFREAIRVVAEAVGRKLK